LKNINISARLHALSLDGNVFTHLASFLYKSGMVYPQFWGATFQMCYL